MSTSLLIPHPCLLVCVLATPTCQATEDVKPECTLPACFHSGDSCRLAVLHLSATIDLPSIHEQVVMADQAKAAMEMLKRALDPKRVERERDALEKTFFDMTEDDDGYYEDDTYDHEEEDDAVPVSDTLGAAATA